MPEADSAVLAAQTTLIPFDSFPPCVRDCGKLYDANGACVPPEKPAGDLGSYASCFCADARVSPFATGTDGVCAAGVCSADPNALQSVHGWFTSFCSQNARALPTTTSGSGQQGGSGNSGNQGPGGDWYGFSPLSSAPFVGSWLTARRGRISMHWRWVIFIVVVVLGIIGIWVGACVWRRRYLRKKDRQYALGKSLAAARHPAPAGQSQRSVHLPQAGLFAPASISAANVYDIEKTTADADRANARRLSRSRKDKKKWVVTERT